MRGIFFLTVMLFAFSCSSNKPEDPLILPPNFAEMPDIKNPESAEKPTTKQQEENVAKLKELLLKSEE